MTRRWPDMRITDDQWSAGDAIVAGVSFIVGVVLIILAIHALAILMTALH